MYFAKDDFVSWPESVNKNKNLIVGLPLRKSINEILK